MAEGKSQVKRYVSAAVAGAIVGGLVIAGLNNMVP